MSKGPFAAVVLVLCLALTVDARAQVCTKTFTVTPTTVSVERSDTRNPCNHGFGSVEERIYLALGG
jgi:hypothetical protein